MRQVAFTAILRQARTRDNKEVRGLRVCQDESCKAHLRLFMGLPPLRQLSERDAELQRHRVALECAQE
jgi:hypothetical protein